MSDEIWTRDEPLSPCIKLCGLHPAAGICTGCFRTGDEIAAWGSMTNDIRAAVMEELPNRASLLTKRRGGRSRKKTI